MLGFGTYELTDADCTNAVQTAIECGYRHIDAARAYGNEVAVGAALSRTEIDRDELFLTSKVWFDQLHAAEVDAQVHDSLRDLQTDYLDLVLIHWPNPEVPLEETIDALDRLKRQELIRQYGVSNFPPSWFRRALELGDIFCNQVEYHPLLGQETLLGIAREHGIMLTAYAPLAQGELLNNATMKSIASKHGCTVGEVAIRWLLDQPQVTTIPRSSNPDHIRSNFQALDLEFEDDDRLKLEQLPKNQRMVNPDFAPDWERG